MKRANEIVPQYSLTGDLISYLRCGLQYRYHNGSSLPPSRPVQMWFGEFIHGVMESSFRLWRSGTCPAFPWPCTRTDPGEQPDSNRPPHDLGVIGEVVEDTLRAQGKSPRSREARISAYRRAEVAVNELGPHLFPLIQSAEEKVIGTRSVQAGGAVVRASLYELHGIIDVLTNVELDGADSGNPIREAIRAACPGLVGEYEVIVDYKGSRRPGFGEAYWEQGEWQVQTYGWLRTRQPDATPVAAGVLIYINELAPGGKEIEMIQRQMRGGASGGAAATDVVPDRGSPDYYKLNAWTQGADIPDLSPEFRFSRAIRVIPVTDQSKDDAVGQFDCVVGQIEQDVSAEADSGTINPHWDPTGDQETCAACDFRHFCPDPAPRNGTHVVEAPAAP